MNEVFETIRYRRSIRSFNDKRVDNETLEKIAKYALYAPSVRNLQQWQITIINNDRKLERLSDTVKTELNRISYHKFYNAKTLMIISVDKRNVHASLEAGCIAQNIMLLAKSLNIGSVWIGQLGMLNDNTNMKRLYEEIGINSKYNVFAAIALGYPKKEVIKEDRINKSHINFIN